MLKDYKVLYPKNQSLIFYYYYSLWMSGLIRKEEEIYENCKISMRLRRCRQTSTARRDP